MSVTIFEDGANGRLNRRRQTPFNVGNAGATGDGQTDDYLAIRDASASQGSTGAIYFPPGTYRVGTNLTINCRAEFEFGATLEPDAGVTVTLAGPVTTAPGASIIATTAAGTVSITGGTMSPRSFTPEMFGAAGDGVTNDTTAITRSLSAASAAGGGVVYLSQRTYAAAGTITIPANVSLRALGGGKRPILAIVGPPTDLTTRAAIVLAGVQSEISGIEVTVTNGDYRRGISAGGADFQRIHDCKLAVTTSDVDGSAVHYAIFSSAVTASNGSEITDNEIVVSVNRPGDHMQISNFKNGLIARNRCVNSTFTGATKFYWAIYISKDCQGTKVSDNYINGNNNGGIHHNNDTGAADSGVEIRGNIVDGTPFIGIACTSTAGVVAARNVVLNANLPFSVVDSTSISISDNYFSGVSASSPVTATIPFIEANSGSSGIRISRNTFGTRGDSLNVVYSDAPDTIVSENVVLASAPVECFQLRGADSQAVNNFLATPTDTSTNGARIRLVGARSKAQGNTVNAVASAGKIGIRAAAANCIVTGNVVTGGVNCIWLDSSSSNALCFQNIVSGSSGAAIQNDGTGNIEEFNSGDTLKASATFDPGSIAAGAVLTTTITVTGAAAGDYAQASFSDTSTGNANLVAIYAKVTGTNTVTVYFQNNHTSSVDLASGTLRARVIKP